MLNTCETTKNQRSRLKLSSSYASKRSQLMLWRQKSSDRFPHLPPHDNLTAGQASVNWSRLEVTAGIWSRSQQPISHLPCRTSSVSGDLQPLASSCQLWQTELGVAAGRLDRSDFTPKFHHLKFYHQESSFPPPTPAEITYSPGDWWFDLLVFKGELFV